MVQAEYEQELQRRKEGFPSVKQAKARLGELDRQITQIAGGIRETIRASYETSRKQEQAPEATIKAPKTDKPDEQERSGQPGNLRPHVGTEHHLYALLLDP